MRLSGPRNLSGVWLDVPFVKQEKNGCGAASIAMVMQFWQRQQGLTPLMPIPTHLTYN